MGTRPEGAVTSEELDDLLNKNGQVRIYHSLDIPGKFWGSFAKDSEGYWVFNDAGKKFKLDWNGVSYGMRYWDNYYIFVNFWLYYAHMLREGKEVPWGQS
jgi:hypothetical protein